MALKELPQVAAVRRRMVAASYAGGVAMLHERTHLHRDLILDLLIEVTRCDRLSAFIQQVGVAPDPPVMLLALYHAWQHAPRTGTYSTFPDYVRRRVRDWNGL